MRGHVAATPSRPAVRTRRCNSWWRLWQTLPYGRDGEVRFLVNRLDGLLEALEQRFSANEGRLQIDGAGELVDVFQYFVEALEMVHDDITVLLQNRQSDENVKVRAEEVGPQTLPHAQDVFEGELALEPDEGHAEEEEEIRAVEFFEVLVECRVEELAEVVEREELQPHAGLVAKEVAFHPAHEVREAPEGYGVVLGDGVDGREQVGHSLDVAEVAVVFVVGEEHVFHLLEVDVGAALGEGGVGIRMWDVLAGEEGDVAVCAVDVLFCVPDGEVSSVISSMRDMLVDLGLTYPHLLLLPPFALLECALFVDHALPPGALESDVLVS